MNAFAFVTELGFFGVSIQRERCLLLIGELVEDKKADVMTRQLVFRSDVAEAGEAHLLNLSIAADWQRKGHGGALLREAIRIATARGARSIFLEVRPSNAGAQALYTRFGFRRIAVRRGYYPALVGREDALVLTLPLA